METRRQIYIYAKPLPMDECKNTDAHENVKRPSPAGPEVRCRPPVRLLRTWDLAGFLARLGLARQHPPPSMDIPEIPHHNVC